MYGRTLSVELFNSSKNQTNESKIQATAIIQVNYSGGKSRHKKRYQENQQNSYSIEHDPQKQTTSNKNKYAT